MTDETAEAKLKRHEDALVACMAEIQRLRAENARLRSSEADAHSTLRMIYGDDSQPAAVRVRAATAALNVETPALQRVPPALELQAEPVEDLATLVHRRRARQTALEPPHRVIDGQVVLLKPNGDSGNGGDTTS